MVKAKVWKIKAMFHGEPKEDDLELVEEDLPDLKEGGKIIFVDLVFTYSLYFK